MEEKLDKLDLNYENLLKEAAQISEAIDRINKNYKETVTKNDLDEFKNVILQALGEIESNKYVPISTIRISCVDRLGSIADFRKLIISILELEQQLQDGNFKEWVLYKDEVFISFYEDSIEINKILNRKDDSLLIETKDKILKELIEEFNAHKICLTTKLEDGFQNWEFFKCERYVKPVDSLLTKLMRLLSL